MFVLYVYICCFAIINKVNLMTTKTQTTNNENDQLHITHMYIITKQRIKQRITKTTNHETQTGS